MRSIDKTRVDRRLQEMRQETGEKKQVQTSHQPSGMADKTWLNPLITLGLPD